MTMSVILSPYADFTNTLQNAKAPRTGDQPFNGLPAQARNECTYMRLPEEIAEDGPAIPASMNPDTNSRNGSDSWDPIFRPNPEQSSSVRDTLEQLVIHTEPPIYEPFASNRNNNANSGSSYNGGDTGLSPDTANSSSNRPTPSSTTPSDTRPNQQNKRTRSGNGSHETSPLPVPPTDPQHRAPMQHFFPEANDFRVISGTGMTPENFTMAETPGRSFDVPGWENISHNQTTGLTPVGEGVFRQLMGLGSMDPM
jgi:hypothetical protein